MRAKVEGREERACKELATLLLLDEHLQPLSYHTWTRKAERQIIFRQGSRCTSQLAFAAATALV